MSCMFCGTSKEDPHRLGAMMKTGKITAHYFCVLLSTGLPQKGRDNQGILGFLEKDINVLLNRKQKVKCTHCHKPTATLHCKECIIPYHLPCMLQSGGCSLFQPEFATVCSLHYQKKMPEESANYTWTCIVCLERIRKNDFNNIENKILITPCCKINLLHESCAHQLVANTAFFTKCPMCQNEKEFKHFLCMNGIFIEHKDSTWRNETINPSPQGNEFTHCSAVDCFCPKGRNYILLGSDSYDLVACSDCGAEAAHWKCVPFCGRFMCRTCTAVNNRLQHPAQKVPTVVLARTDEAGPSGVPSARGDVENNETYNERKKEGRPSRILGEITNDRRTRSPSRVTSPWLNYARRVNCRYNLRRKDMKSAIINYSSRGRLLRAVGSSPRRERHSENRSTLFSPGRRARVNHRSKSCAR